MSNDVKERLEDLVAPPPRPGFRDNLWESAELRDRIAARRWRLGAIVASGIKGVVIAHGVVDGLVTHDESRQLQALLRAQGVPVDMASFLTHSKTSEAGTTVDGYAPVPHDSPFAGHASETSTTQDVGVAGFAALANLYKGAGVTCTESLYDGATSHALTTNALGC